MALSTPKPIFYIPIHGTWAIDDTEIAWWKFNGNFAQYAKRFNCFQFDRIVQPDSQEALPFTWTSDLTGVRFNLFNRNAKHSAWRGAGYSLNYYCQNIPLEHRNFILHSHGLQCWLYATARGLKSNNVISVCSPIRNDLMTIMRVAPNMCNKWMHIYSNSDKVQFLGQFGDGRILGSRKVEVPGVINHRLKIDHSSVFNERIDYWVKEGWFDFLRTPMKEET